MKALCYGSLNPDLVHRMSRLPQAGDDLFSDGWELLYGGGAGNSAVALATWGVKTTLIGNALGSDPLGAWLLEILTRPNLDLSRIRLQGDVTTPHCVVMTTPDGDRTIVSTGYRDARWQAVPGDIWEGLDVVLVDGYSAQAGTAVALAARRRGKPVVGLDAGGKTAGACSLVVWSRHEHPDEERARRLAAGGRAVVLTGGSGDVQLWSGDRAWSAVPPPVVPVDGTGAGDVFAAMCAYGLAAGWKTGHLLRMATAAGAVLTGRGRTAGMPTLDEITAAAAAVTVG